MRRINYFFNVPESKEDCENTECQNCEYMRALIMEYTEYGECFDTNKNLRHRASISLTGLGE